MTEKEKRIVLRVDPETWRQYDDKRHAERTSFQDLGLRLFGRWFRGERSSGENRGKEDVKNYPLGDKLHDTDLKHAEVWSESELPWVQALVRILQSGNEVAVRALKSNLLAFSDYVRAVPEAQNNGLADIAAQEVRVASVKQRLVDARKNAAVGTDPNAAKPRKSAPKEAVRKRV